MRWSLPPWLLAFLALATGCAEQRDAEPASGLAGEVDMAIGKGVTFLLERQDEDGAWRSDIYGAFRRGDALTPLALRALLAVPPTPAVRRAVDLGSDYLAALAPPRDAAEKPPLFAVYTASQAIEVLSRSSDPRHRDTLEAWIADLKGRQLIGELGWDEDDPQFGGWGYSTALPAKPPPATFQAPLVESNTSATVFALRGLRAAGVPTDGPVCRQALVFLERMQNYSKSPSALDDGGFFFLHDDPVRNKAGVAGNDESGRARFHSYGSTTADGLRGLLLCGRTTEDPRVRAALAWLEENFSSAKHPGRFEPRLEADRDGLYYYWAASVTEALAAAKNGPKSRPPGKPPESWAEELARELIVRQGPRGAWINEVVTMREDEPVIASAMALLALSGLRSLVSRAALPVGSRP